MSGTPTESSPLSQHDAVEMLLNVNTAPEEASQDVEEQTAETTDEVEATEVEYEEVEAVESDQAEMEADETEDDGEVLTRVGGLIYVAQSLSANIGALFATGSRRRQRFRFQQQ